MNHSLKLFLSVCLFPLICALSVMGQTRNEAATASDVLLTVGGEVKTPLKLTAADLAKLPRRTVTAKDHDKETTFEGVPLVEVLKLAGVEFGEKMRGKSLAMYLLAEATDGYRVIFALPEFDPAFTEKVILLADKRDGKSLSGEEGQLRIVVPDEKRGGRWIRQLVKLTLRGA